MDKGTRHIIHSKRQSLLHRIDQAEDACKETIGGSSAESTAALLETPHLIEPIDPDNNEEGFALEEQKLLSSYRSLDSVPYLATRRCLITGDDRLVTAIYNQIFLGVRPGKLRD